VPNRLANLLYTCKERHTNSAITASGFGNLGTKNEKSRGAAELVVTNFELELEEWNILIKLRDGTGYELEEWSSDKAGGWDTLEEEHKDPSQCSGIEVDASGKITWQVRRAYSDIASDVPCVRHV
jgi:hypothetical protein